jgi:hypothetical protein
MQKLTAEFKAIEDADPRMSIWPLIEAGEFSTMSEGLTQNDKALKRVFAHVRIAPHSRPLNKSVRCLRRALSGLCVGHSIQKNGREAVLRCSLPV